MQLKYNKAQHFSARSRRTQNYIARQCVRRYVF